MTDAQAKSTVRLMKAEMLERGPKDLLWEQVHEARTALQAAPQQLPLPLTAQSLLSECDHELSGPCVGELQCDQGMGQGGEGCSTPMRREPSLCLQMQLCHRVYAAVSQGVQTRPCM